MWRLGALTSHLNALCSVRPARFMDANRRNEPGGSAADGASPSSHGSPLPFLSSTALVGTGQC